MEKNEYSGSIRNRIKESKSGMLFVMQDFADIAPNNAANRVIKRLVDEGCLRSVVRGVYVKPNFNAFLGEFEDPLPEDVAIAIGRKNGWIVRPDGDLALNLIGLSTQVPSVWSFVSDGPYKTYSYGAGKIVLKHTASRLMAKLTRETALVVQAFRAIGKERVDESVLQKLATRYSLSQVEHLVAETLMAPDWIRSKVRQLREYVHA